MRIFDLQIEAEVLGCDLMWADDGPPSVASHPLATEMGDTPVVPCECTLPGPNDGRIPLVCEAMRRVKKEIGDTTALYGLITGPFTLASHLRGTDIFLDMLLWTTSLSMTCSTTATRPRARWRNTSSTPVWTLSLLLTR